MKRKFRLNMFFCFFMLLKLTRDTYVCPVEMDAVKHLIEFRYQFLCNNDSTDCLITNKFRKDSYSDFIILLHNGDWSLIKRVIRRVSLCNVKYILIDVNSPIAEFNSTCSMDRATLIVSLTTDLYSKQKVRNEDCVANGHFESDKLQTKISSSCPNTIWITGTTNCTNFTSSVEKIFELDNKKTNGKTYLTGRHLRLGMIIQQPYYFETSPGVHSGILHNLVEKISTNLQFSYSVHYPKDNFYGEQNENGTWNGMIGEMINNKTDAIFADLTVTRRRNEYIDFTVPFYFESIGILIRQPELDSKLWKMLSLFQSNIWIAMLATVVVGSLILYGLHKFSAVPNGSPFNKLSECVWCTVSCFVNQGSQYYPETWSAQNFMTLFSLYIFAVLSIYSGGLIAMLTSSRMVLPFKDLESLSMAVQQGRYKVCIHKATAFYATIMAGEGFYGPIRDWLLKNPTYLANPNWCLELFKKSTDVAYLEEITYLERIQNKNCDKIRSILLNDRFFPGYFSIGLPKKSPFNEIFSDQITRAVDGGLIMGWKNNYTSLSFCQNFQPDDVVVASSSNLSLSQFMGPLVLFGTGMIFSLIGFSAEICRRYFNNQKTIEIDLFL